MLIYRALYLYKHQYQLYELTGLYVKHRTDGKNDLICQK